MIDLDDTIVAIASPASPAPRGVVRLSGNEMLAILRGLGVAPNDFRSAYRLDASLDLAEPLGAIRAGILIWPTGRSYTGQPSAEIHLVGSVPVLQSLVARCVQLGARPARPGEFTMRAFLAGRLDLMQAEAVLGVIEAEGRGTLDHALTQLAGNLSRPLEALRSELLDLLADVEAGLDFVDEDIEFISDAVLEERLSRIAASLAATRERLEQRGGGGERPLAALCGEPNAGKSELLNRLAGQAAAIVADIPGTTRDTVTIDLELDGLALRIVDTAGIEPVRCEVSEQAQRHSERAAREAAVRVWCVDWSRPDIEAGRQFVRAAAARRRRGQADLWVGTKCDRCRPPQPEHPLSEPWIVTSSRSGVGVESLRQAVRASLAGVRGSESGSVIGTAERCRASLHAAAASIDSAISMTQSGEGHELVAAEMRSAVESLGEVTGAVYTDDILDRVFGRFCIGK